jgi:hypothetical protein
MAVLPPAPKRSFDVEYSTTAEGDSLCRYDRLPFDSARTVAELREEIRLRSGWSRFDILARKELDGIEFHLHDHDTLSDVVRLDESSSVAFITAYKWIHSHLI